MPNTWLPLSTNKTPGMIMLEDAMNMRHPLTGSGITVALKDVVLLGAMLSPAEVLLLDDTGAVLEQMRKFH
jgi:squalene monooxygenase